MDQYGRYDMKIGWITYSVYCIMYFILTQILLYSSITQNSPNLCVKQTDIWDPLFFWGGVTTMYPSMGGKEDSAGGLFDGLPAAEEHGSAAPKSQAVPQARKHVMIKP